MKTNMSVENSILQLLHETCDGNDTEKVNWEYIKTTDWPDVQHFKKYLLNIIQLLCLLIKRKV